MDTERQSGIQYLQTEDTLSKETGRLIRDPIRVFDLTGLGIDKANFLSDLAPSFKDLSWDPYEARHRRFHLLMEAFPKEHDRLHAFFPSFYEQGDDALDEIRDLMRQLSFEQRYAYDQIRSYRRRSIAKFLLSNRFHSTWEGQWHIVQTQAEGFVQSVGEGDNRRIRRVFDDTSATVIGHIGFQRLVVAVAEMVEDAEEDFAMDPVEMEVTFHQMGLVARPGQDATNAPEGTHKDGVDYIVSALVVERHGVEGGVSIVKADDKTTHLLEIKLEPGQGIFQADKFSQLWHDVTPIRVKESALGDVEDPVRNIFGFDVIVTKREPKPRL